ncbi:hypothetical protein JW707_04060 [Candidatus Woesearchaeota archaeon]|nr:hypothetical protein [Candidatus Woesearchaeota archaeon]
MSPSKRKAQMEIMGLAIIFILVIFGVLFGVRFVITKPDSDIRKGFQESTLAANMLTAIRGTTTDCNDASVEQLLQDCASEKAIICEGTTSCKKAEKVIGQIFKETMEVWERSYNFSIQGTYDVSQISFGQGDCSGEKEVKTHPVPTRAGTIVLRLEICS